MPFVALRCRLPVCLAVLLCAAFTLPAHAQDSLATRGTRPSESGTAVEGMRRALIVGISQYAHLPETKQLRYADDDAEMVYAFLQSEAGGPTDEAVLLRDQEATAARITAELTRLREAADAGDEIIFYFAGHGDVERIAENTQRGRLLAYDAPSAQNYVGNGGTIPVLALRDVTSEIIQKGARVLIITDACRSGSVNNDLGVGARLTSAVLAADWSRVVRFASSGADQLSQEDASLGHGVFTYYLLDGLLGAADAMIRNDGRVDHTELQLYVTQQVARRTESRQAPVLTGDPKRPLAVVDPAVTWQTLEALVPPRSQTQRYQLLGELQTEEREKTLEAALSDSSRALTQRFEAALRDGRLLQPGGAVDLYERLRGAVPATYFSRLGDLLATALEDQAQATLAAYFQAGATGGSATDGTDAATGATADGKGPDVGALFSLPADEIEQAAQAMQQAQALRGASYPGYASLRSRARFLSGLTHLLKKEYSQAVQTLSALELPSAFALSALGLAHYKVEDLDAARESLARAVDLAPNWSEPRRYQGFVAQYEQDWEAALGFYQSAIDRAPDNAILHVDLGEVHDRQGDPARADAAWTEALRLNPEAAAPAIARFLLTRSQRPDRIARAEAVYREALQAAPQSAPLATRQGDVYRTQGRAEEAEAAYRTALDIDATYPEAHNGLGLLFEFQERYGEAAAAYQQATSHKPDWAAAHRNLGDVYRKQERYEAAIAAYQQALSVSPAYSPAHIGLGRVYIQQERDEEAEQALRRGADLAETATAYNTLGVFYENAGRYDEAINAYEKARALDASALILANLGDAYRKAGRPYFAAGVYKQALRRDPAQRLALTGLERLADQGVVPDRERASETIPGQLTASSATLDDGTFYASHERTGRAGDEWTVLLRSDAFDPFLLVIDLTSGSPVELDRDDDSGPGTHALAQVTLPRDGRYALWANTYAPGAQGSYEIVLYRSSQRANDPPTGQQQVFRDELTTASPTLEDDGSYYNAHRIDATAGERLTVTLASDVFDAFLMVMDPTGEVIARDDDGAGGTNARAHLGLSESGTYTLLVNTYEAGQTGAYTLTVERARGTTASSAGASPATDAILPDLSASPGDAQIFDGEVTAASPTLDADGSFFESHAMQGTEGQAITATLTSSAFDAYLVLMDPDGNVLARDDDSAGGTDARVQATLPATGTYVFVVNTYGSGQTGRYTLTVQPQ